MSEKEVPDNLDQAKEMLMEVATEQELSYINDADMDE